jgi:hypothetical protein
MVTAFCDITAYSPIYFYVSEEHAQVDVVESVSSYHISVNVQRHTVISAAFIVQINYRYFRHWTASKIQHNYEALKQTFREYLAAVHDGTSVKHPDGDI